MKRFIITVAALLFATPAAAFPVTVESCGAPVTFERAPERLVVHDINMVEMALSLGLQDRMVGVTGITGWYKTSKAFNAKLGNIPELAPKYPSLEVLVSAAPDLFFAGWYYGMKPGGEVTPESLEAHDVKTLVLSESCSHLHKNSKSASMDLLFDDVLRLGTVFGRETAAETLVDGWTKQLDAIRQMVGNRAGTRVFLYDSGQEKPFTAGRKAIANAMIEAAGGINVMNDMDVSWGRTSWETVALRDPEFLILLDYSNGGGAMDLLEFLKTHPAMKETQAVRNERFVPLRYEELTPGPANIAAIAKITKAMFPGDS